MNEGNFKEPEASAVTMDRNGVGQKRTGGSAKDAKGPALSVSVRRIPSVSAREASGMSTSELREHFLGDGFGVADQISMIYWENDRTVVGLATPTVRGLQLEASDELKSKYFCERREIGVVNLGGAGTVDTDDASFNVKPYDFLYIGAGTEKVIFSSDDPETPARYYFVSYLAHRGCGVVHLPFEGRQARELGGIDNCNERKLYPMITPDSVGTCQLVMGMTFLTTGSVWNTMPSHTHSRRSEVYFYFDLAEEAVVIHLMGQPKETRHLVVRNQEVVLSPSWSIHSGVGTANYGFVWAMGGENQAFDDMDMVAMEELR